VQLQETDLAAEARKRALELGQTVQTGINRFAEGEYDRPRQGGQAGRSGPGPEPEKRDFWDSFGDTGDGPEKDKKDFWESFGAAPKGPPREKKDFWDEFAGVAETRQKPASASKPTSIGTSAMKKPSGGAGGAGAKENEDGWGEW